MIFFQFYFFLHCSFYFQVELPHDFIIHMFCIFCFLSSLLSLPYQLLLFHHVLVLHNKNKIQTLQFLFEFFSFLSPTNLLWKLRSMIISFWPLIISSPFCCYKFNISMFSDNFHNFPKNWIIHQPFLKSFFAFFVSLVFISACGLSFLIKLNLSMNSCQN